MPNRPGALVAEKLRLLAATVDLVEAVLEYKARIRSELTTEPDEKVNTGKKETIR